MRVLTDTRWLGVSGVGRYAHEIMKRLSAMEFQLLGVRHHKYHQMLSPFYLTLEIIRNKPAVFWSPQFIPPFYSAVPFVFTVHDLLHIHYGTKAQTEFYNRIVKPACKRAFRVITVSESSKREIVEWANIEDDRVIVTYNAVSEHFSPRQTSLQNETPYILYVGNHRPHKNLPKLLQAFAISEICNYVELVLTGPSNADLIAIAQRLGIQKKVRFIGEPNETGLIELYRGALTLVNVSLYEGFGLPPLEAMACGIPCVVSNTTAFPEIVGDAGILVDPYDVEHISHGLVTSVQNTRLRLELHRLGIERANRFSWDRSSDIVASTLREATGLGGTNSVQRNTP